MNIYIIIAIIFIIALLIPKSKKKNQISPKDTRKEMKNSRTCNQYPHACDQIHLPTHVHFWSLLFRERHNYSLERPIHSHFSSLEWDPFVCNRPYRQSRISIIHTARIHVSFNYFWRRQQVGVRYGIGETVLSKMFSAMDTATTSRWRWSTPRRES